MTDRANMSSNGICTYFLLFFGSKLHFWHFWKSSQQRLHMRSCTCCCRLWHPRQSSVYNVQRECNEKLTVASDWFSQCVKQVQRQQWTSNRVGLFRGKKLLCIKAKTEDTLVYSHQLLLCEARPKTWEDYKLLIRWNQSAEGLLLSLPACFVSAGLG